MNFNYEILLCEFYFSRTLSKCCLTAPCKFCKVFHFFYIIPSLQFCILLLSFRDTMLTRPTLCEISTYDAIQHWND